MLLSYKLVVYSLILILLILAITSYNQRNVRKYTPILKKQVQELVETANQHIETAKHAANSIVSMQQASYAAATLDAIRTIVTDEDLPRLSNNANIEKMEREVRKLQNEFNQKLHQVVAARAKTSTNNVSCADDEYD
jgi:polyhydroxyalkanoate synthesis regulator phasin